MLGSSYLDPFAFGIALVSLTLARRVHRLDHRRRESGRLVVDSVALGITLAPLTSAVACIVSVTVGLRVRG